MTVPSPVNVVCMLVGDRYPNVYVHRLASMLRRNMHVPHTLTCIVDRPRSLPPDVEMIDASEWTHMKREGMRVTTNKIRLFDPEVIPFEEFLYLDVTLVIQKDMRPLLEYAIGRPEDLVIVKDWNYDCYNSCVMRIRKSESLQKIYQAFVDGMTFPYRNPGDQDFIHSAACHLGLEDKVAFFLKHHVVSYRNLRGVHRKNPETAYAEIEKGIIVKFYGKPKMHQVANPLYNFFRMRLKRGPADARFWRRELKQHWR